MREQHLLTLVVVGAIGCFAAACGTVGSDEPGEELSLAGANVYTATFRTALKSKYVSAENGGGSVLVANRDAAQAWETFKLYDVNGGDLVSGDLITMTAAGGQYVCAENGGGGQINATRAAALDWETFRILKVGGAGVIKNGDSIALQTKTLGRYVTALDGGGGGMLADRTAVQSWETFVVGLSGGGATSGGSCAGDQLARCNCPSGFFCCPTDGSCFKNPSDIIYTQCKDNSGATCSMGGTSTPAPTPTPTPTPSSGGGSTRLRITSNCADPIWIAHSDNVPDTQNIQLTRGQSHDYTIPTGALSATRFWPKTGCDGSGHACATGDSGEGGGKPCPANGCQPPVDSKFEASFAAVGSSDQTWYNLSQVDGYTLPFKVQPFGSGAEKGSCVSSDCSRLSLNSCPGDENLSGNGVYPAYTHEDLRVRDASGKVIACLAPCKKWNYPAPYGLGQPESKDPGLHLCCPTPFDPASGQCTAANGCISPQACSNAADPLSIERSSYVAAMRSMCPTAYSYAYDDAAGLHACPSDTRFEVTFCP